MDSTSAGVNARRIGDGFPKPCITVPLLPRVIVPTRKVSETLDKNILLLSAGPSAPTPFLP